ncbi:MAG: zinc ribbon domain-containing protein [bacterium]|nr:zinc ribbon domain-containing protein [bacterium]
MKAIDSRKYKKERAEVFGALLSAGAELGLEIIEQDQAAGIIKFNRPAKLIALVGTWGSKINAEVSQAPDDGDVVVTIESRTKHPVEMTGQQHKDLRTLFEKLDEHLGLKRQFVHTDIRLACLKCGAPLQAGAKFCTGCGSKAEPLKQGGPASCQCGAPLVHGAKFCSSCGAAVTVAKPDGNSCSKCGVPLKPDAIFCTSCGAKTAAAS